MASSFQTSGYEGSQTQDGNGAEELVAQLPALAQKVAEQARRVPELIDHELKENPYRLLGIVGAVGVGIGMLIGSRVMRAVIISVGGYAVTEALRGYVGDQLKQVTGGGDGAQRPN